MISLFALCFHTISGKDKSLVDKRFEISNLELKRDINSIIKLGKILYFIEYF